MNTRYILPLFLLSASAAVAQDLNKEITIEKEIVPEQRAATRLNVPHSIITPQIRKSNLRFSDSDPDVRLAPGIVTLDPARTAAAVGAYPYRGYIDAGYFPVFNASVSAGYRLVNRRNTSLDASLQYSGFSYGSDSDDAAGKEIKTADNSFDFALGVDHRFNEAQRLRASVNIGFSSVKRPGQAAWTPDYTQFSQLKNGNTRGRLDAVWTSGDEVNNYRVDFGVGVFANSADSKSGSYGLLYKPEFPDAIREISGNIGLGVNYGEMGIDVSANILNYNSFNQLAVMKEPAGADFGMGLLAGSGKTMALVSLTPRYTHVSETFRARLGARVEYTAGSRKNFHVAPDVSLSVIPSSAFAASLTVKGGEQLNSQEDLFALCRYVSPFAAYLTSHVPVDACLRMVVGPFRGASVELFGNYAVANNWLMPVMGSGPYFMPTYMKGWRAGVRLRYNYRDIVDFAATAQFAPQGHERGYYLWRDRARQVGSVEVAVHPFSELTVSVSFEVRRKRVMESMTFVASDAADSELPVTHRFSEENLGTVGNLSLGASYRFTPALTFFLRGENLLNRHTYDIQGIRSRGVTGLLGLGYKF